MALSFSLSSPLLMGSMSSFRLDRFPSHGQSVRPRKCRAIAKTPLPEPLRRSANYPPSLWDDSYIQSLTSDFEEVDENATKIDQLKKDVMKHLMNEEKGIVEQLELIDTLKQLRVAYHFEEEINSVLKTIYRSAENILKQLGEDLHAKALLFRLLREKGFNISQDVFNSFKNEKGSFKASLCRDTKGMLSLYEASYFSIKGENTMDEARDFTTKHLNNQLNEDSYSSEELCVKERVARALEIPMHWSMQSLHARWFIDVYGKMSENINHVLLEFAKRDFNAVQRIHRRGLKNVSTWWSELGFPEKLSFSRDRLMENYLGALALVFEPEFGTCREILTKLHSFITTIDDVYDVYGSLDELELFTNAVDRWDATAAEQLPEYMKICFLGLFNTTNDTANTIFRTKGVKAISYLKKTWADLCKAYLVEAKWYYSGYTPTFDEYLENAWVSVSGPVIITHLYFFVSREITKEALQCLETYPDIVRHSSMILRLWDDLGTSMEEVKRGDVPKSIQCYMLQECVSEEVAREHVKDVISSIWKEMNGDRIAKTPLHESFLTAVMNVARMGQCTYQYGDGYGTRDSHQTKNAIAEMVIDPILLN